MTKASAVKPDGGIQLTFGAAASVSLLNAVAVAQAKGTSHSTARNAATADHGGLAGGDLPAGFADRCCAGGVRVGAGEGLGCHGYALLRRVMTNCMTETITISPKKM